MAYKIKPWEDLTIQDDYMFKLIMSRKRICKKMLEKILQIKIHELKYIEEEKTMKVRYESKGVRMDIYVEDEKKTIYNVEMQMRQPGGYGLSKRTRYYQSMIDADLLLTGADYDALNRCIIIFICPFDAFDRKRHIYTFRNYCEQDKTLELHDDATKIFLNTKGTADDVSTDVKAFLDYVDGVVSNDDLVQDIEQEIKKVKRIEKERVSYMTFAMKMMEEHRAGHEEGFREGMEQGIEQGAKKQEKMVVSLIKLGTPIEVIEESTGWSADKIHTIVAQYKALEN